MMDARLHAWVADALHRLVEEALGMLTYYADPYSPWQRASNENRNGMIRRYLPKHTSLKNLTQTELDDIVTEINDTPMKLLDYHTPNEAWQEEISKLVYFVKLICTVGTAVGILDRIHPMLPGPNPCDTAWGSYNPGRSLS